MKKIILASFLLVIMHAAIGKNVSLPREHIAMPKVNGTHLVCLWDEAAGVWLSEFEDYDHAGSYTFQFPEWGKWYWIGLWDNASKEYVFGKWVGNFLEE